MSIIFNPLIWQKYKYLRSHRKNYQIIRLVLIKELKGIIVNSNIIIYILIHTLERAIVDKIPIEAYNCHRKGNKLNQYFGNIKRHKDSFSKHFTFIFVPKYHLFWLVCQTPDQFSSSV